MDRYKNIKNPHIQSNIKTYKELNGIDPTPSMIDLWIKQENDFVKQEEAKNNKLTDDAKTEVIYSGDPNDIYGPAGYGAAGFVQLGQLLPYQIVFENIPTGLRLGPDRRHYPTTGSGPGPLHLPAREYRIWRHDGGCPGRSFNL